MKGNYRKFLLTVTTLSLPTICLDKIFRDAFITHKRAI